MSCAQGGGPESRPKPAPFDHESDSGLSGSLTDSGRALADDVDAPARSPGTCGSTAAAAAASPYSQTGSYCPARAADERRCRPATAQPSYRRQQPSCRTARNIDRTILQLPAHDTYV